MRPPLFALILVAPTVSLAAQEPPAPLEPCGTIELPGVRGRIDHLAVDLARRRVFVAALGNESVEVVDLAAGKRLQSLGGLGEPQGILYVERADRIVVACGDDGTCVLYDGTTLRHVRTLEVGADADNLRYDAASGRVWVACGSALGVLDLAQGKVLGTTALAAHPEGFQLDPAGRRVLVNVPGARQIAVVELGDAPRLSATWPVEEAASNYPLALVPGGPASADAVPAPELVLVGCRSPATLVVRSAADGAARQTLELAEDVDDLFYDTRSRRVFAICGGGSVDVFERDATGALLPLARILTAPGARTGLLVPELGELFVAVPERGTARAELRRFRLAE
jgi:hypothetical protein